MQSFRAELHIHTVLSPCAGVEMIPPLIVNRAVDLGLDLIAITDHNASENAAAVLKAAQNTGLTVLPGMELQTAEEIHVLCLFDTLEQLSELQNIVNHTLPDISNNIEFFGEQFIVDQTGEFIHRKDQLLINSTDLSIEDAEKAVHDLDGLFIPAHINRQAFGLLHRLGFVPPGLNVDALEISRHTTPEKCFADYPMTQGYPIIQSGDVHFLDGFLGACQFTLQEPSISEIKLAFEGKNERTMKLL